MPNGNIYLAFQAGECNADHGRALVGISMAESWGEDFMLVTPDPVTPYDWDPLHPVCWAGVDEDPFLWIDKRGFHILTHGMCPSGLRQAHYKFSEDGKSWHTSMRQTYHYKVNYLDGSSHVFGRVERPQLWFDTIDPVSGYAIKPTVLFNGVCGTSDVGSRFECVFDKLTGMTWTLARPLGGEEE